MRLTTVILIATLMQVSAAGLAQKINLSKSNVPLKAILKEIRTQSGYDFVYAEEIFDVAKPVNIQVKDAELQDVLKEIFKAQPLTFTISKTTVTIQPKEPTFLDRLATRWASIDANGRVVDSENRPLPGASVKVKKTGKGVSTDKDGRFFLRGVEEGAVLVISFIGYLTKEVSASANMGNVALEQSLSKLDEVQVIAYGTTTQRLSTGNVTTIKADVIEKQPVNNPLLALHGRVPGLFIEQATGFAGTGVKVRIQGTNSIANGNDPLYVIDGIPFTSQLLPGGNSIIGGSGGSGENISSVGNPMSFINPADIESIDVLKDADATAIYGSRAANGAILITTKKGKAGDTKVNLNLQSGWAKVPRKLDLMNSPQYLEMRREALKNDGIIDPAPGPYGGDNDLNGNWDNTRYTDWQKELIGGTATYQDFNASVSGGNDRTSFLIGAGHHRETTVFPGNYADSKTSIHFNLNNTSVNQKFTIKFSGSYLIDDNKLPNVDLTTVAMQLAPVAPALYKADGEINWAADVSGNTTFGNPIGYMFNSFFNKTSNLMSNMTLSYQILPGLEVKSIFGYNNLKTNIINKSLLRSVIPEALQYRQRFSVFANSDINSWSVEPQLTYGHNIGKGRLEILLGATISKNASLGSELAASGFSNDLVMEDILSATSLSALSSTSSTYKYNAAFGRINYNWQNKYILNFTGRRDGSSRFGPKSQFHNFGALGGAWIFSSENLIKNYLPLLSFGKLRMSYGTTGSDQIGNYRFLSLYDPLQQDIPYQGIVAYQVNRLTNPYLEWEETRKMQFGMDLGFFKDRILLNANYYRNRTSNQLSGYTLPVTTGFGYIDKNQTDKVENSGWEFTITTTNLQDKDFKWTSSINLTLPKTLLSASTDTRFPSKPVVGDPLSATRVYHFLGVDPATGIYQFEDHNGNPTFSPDPSLDKTVVIDTAPKFYGGVQNSFSYKDFQLEFLFSFVKQVAQDQRFFGFNGPGGNYGYGNQLSSLMSRWQKPGDISSIQRFSTNGSEVFQALGTLGGSDAAWTDASYISLKNISLSWRLPEALGRRVHLQNCSLFAQGQNLWTFTGYNGLDPETKNLSLPPLRVITVGLKVTL